MRNPLYELESLEGVEMVKTNLDAYDGEERLKIWYLPDYPHDGNCCLYAQTSHKRDTPSHPDMLHEFNGSTAVWSYMIRDVYDYEVYGHRMFKVPELRIYKNDHVVYTKVFGVGTQKHQVESHACKIIQRCETYDLNMLNDDMRGCKFKDYVAVINNTLYQITNVTTDTYKFRFDRVGDTAGSHPVICHLFETTEFGEFGAGLLLGHYERIYKTYYSYFCTTIESTEQIINYHSNQDLTQSESDKIKNDLNKFGVTAKGGTDISKNLINIRIAECHLSNIEPLYHVTIQYEDSLG